jgi:hypothetical protein
MGKEWAKNVQRTKHTAMEVIWDGCVDRCVVPGVSVRHVPQLLNYQGSLYCGKVNAEVNYQPQGHRVSTQQWRYAESE